MAKGLYMQGKTLTILLILCLPARWAIAEVVSFDVKSRGDLPGGIDFGLAGEYEKIAGKVFFEVDPETPANRIIVDLDYAPRNSRGKIEFAADFFLLKPKQIERGNGTLLVGVPNRGSKRLLTFFNHASAEGRKWDAPDPQNVSNLGDGFLMRNGFTLLWIGWQFDTPENGENMRAYLPSAQDGELSISGLVRSDFVVTEKVLDFTLGDRNHIAYPVSDPLSPDNVLTVRDTVEGVRRVIDRKQWSFGRAEGGRVVPDTTRVYLETGFEPHRIYEVVYTSSDPTVIGLGLAGIRDLVSHLKHLPAEPLSIPAGTLKRAIGFGLSQPGRLLRNFVYDGFNGDEAGHRVFDGVIAHIAGAGRGSFNIRFGQASRDAHAFLNFFYPTDIFPFTDVEQTDPLTGQRGGLLRDVPDQHMPRFFQTFSSYEYWGRAASLLHTTVDGRDDAPMLENTRIYHFTGGQHLPAKFPPAIENGQQLNNPNDYSYAMRALLLAMNRWITYGTPPPDSRYPTIRDGNLADPDKVTLPEIPGVAFPTHPHKAYRVDYGPEFESAGIISKEPPEVGPAYPILVPQVDRDGNETGGLRMPDIEVPLATYTGWNLYTTEYGPETEIAHMSGSYIPLAKTKVEREANGDPRPSIEERYDSEAEYLGLYAEAAIRLINDGYLLPEDLPELLERALYQWEYHHGRAEPVPDGAGSNLVCTVARMGKECGY